MLRKTITAMINTSAAQKPTAAVRPAPAVLSIEK
jgi:hypothetical protein